MTQKRSIGEETFTFQRDGFTYTIRREIFETPQKQPDFSEAREIPGAGALVEGIGAMVAQYQPPPELSDMVDVTVSHADPERPKQHFCLSGEQYNALIGAIGAMRMNSALQRDHVAMPMPMPMLGHGRF